MKLRRKCCIAINFHINCLCYFKCFVYFLLLVLLIIFQKLMVIWLLTNTWKWDTEKMDLKGMNAMCSWFFFPTFEGQWITINKIVALIVTMKCTKSKGKENLQWRISRAVGVIINRDIIFRLHVHIGNEKLRMWVHEWVRVRESINGVEPCQIKLKETNV